MRANGHLKMKRISARIIPEKFRNKLSGFEKCLYGVSVGAVNQNIDDIISGYLWARLKFKRCCILLGDSLYRFTIQIQRAATPEEAAQLARQCGNVIAEQMFSRLQDLPEIIRCSDILSSPHFSIHKNKIEALYIRNELLNASIVSDATNFVERQVQKSRLKISEHKAIDLATSYLIEEIAIYSYLADQGWLVDVYKGDELPTLAKIISGEISGIDGALTNRINISLRLR